MLLYAVCPRQLWPADMPMEQLRVDGSAAGVAGRAGGAGEGEGGSGGRLHARAEQTACTRCRHVPRPAASALVPRPAVSLPFRSLLSPLPFRGLLPPLAPLP
ncbi:hypothetical protein GCM10018793_68480 [Streptomyces sulfonofaciens]|uniref:Uncharacterized protein n=1 Tax=Streptomyces sulfonofaciens TaxID=68272 RepID=A0A919GPT9_9ACTN|nr:hypothetical protein GCM10018793_68480 [Streptomyces sulfonofaciens]